MGRQDTHSCRSPAAGPAGGREAQRPDPSGAEAASRRSQAARSAALPLARQRAATSLTAPGTLPAGTEAVAAGTAPFLDLSGTEICGITLSSGRCTPGSLLFSAAVTAGLRVGNAREAAVMGTGDEAGAEAGVAGWAQAALAAISVAMQPRREAQTFLMGHRESVRCIECQAPVDRPV